MTWFLIAVRQEVKRIDNSVVVASHIILTPTRLINWIKHDHSCKISHVLLERYFFASLYELKHDNANKILCTQISLGIYYFEDSGSTILLPSQI